MTQWLRDLDRILRGQATNLPALREGRIEVRARALTGTLIVLGMVYGFCMGWFALLNRVEPEYMQVLASMVKLPLLFLLTLVVTFPSLYVFNALVGSRLTLESVARLLLAAMAVTLAVLASFGPIIAFFSLTSESYPFILLLNVVLCAAAGALGLSFLLQTLHRLTVAMNPPPPAKRAGELRIELPEGEETAPPRRVPSAIDPLEGHAFSSHVKSVFRIWIVVFAVVGAQMSWVLRPFIGDPGLPFAWFRERESNFFEAVARTIERLFS